MLRLRPQRRLHADEKSQSSSCVGSTSVETCITYCWWLACCLKCCCSCPSGYECKYRHCCGAFLILLHTLFESWFQDAGFCCCPLLLLPSSSHSSPTTYKILWRKYHIIVIIITRKSRDTNAFLRTIQHYNRTYYIFDARKKEDDDMLSGKSSLEFLLEPRLPPLPLRILKSPLASWAFVPIFFERN